MLCDIAHIGFPQHKRQEIKYTFETTHDYVLTTGTICRPFHTLGTLIKSESFAVREINNYQCLIGDSPSLKHSVIEHNERSSISTQASTNYH